MNPTLNNMFLFAYGLIVSLTYLVMSKGGGPHSLSYFFYSSIALSVLFAFKSKLKGVFNPLSNARGFLFGSTQYLLVKSQMGGTVSSSFVGALAGIITAGFLSNIFLKEPIKKNIIPLILALGGCFTLSTNHSLALTPFIAGVLQGVSTTLTRGISQSKETFYTSIFLGFFWSVIVGPFFTSLDSTEITIPILTLYIFSVGVCQLAYFKLYSENLTLKASIVGLGRIPWAIGIECITLKTAPSVTMAFGSTLIFLGAIFNLLGKKSSHKTQESRSQ